MKKRYDYRFTLLALVANGLTVFFINLQSGGTSEAGISSIVQLFVSGGLAGHTLQYTKNHASDSPVIMAYLHGSLIMATFVAFFGGLAHWIFATPELLGTIAWNFFLNLFGGAAMVSIKRYTGKNKFLRVIAEKL